MKTSILAINSTRNRRSWFTAIVRTKALWIILLASLLLSGCVQYNVGVNFDHPNRGAIVQHVKLGERLVSFSGDTATEWLASIERRAKQLEGSTKRLSDREVIVTIPFNNGSELEAKYNEFFHPAEKKEMAMPGERAAEIANIDSQLHLKQNNLVVLVRNRLSYDLDLRSLSLISTNTNVLVDPSEILDLEFAINTPWGARSVKTGDAISPQKDGQKLVWKLKPGQANHIEAVFWLPNLLGIGSVLIILLVAAGMYLRYNFMPPPKPLPVTR